MIRIPLGGFERSPEGLVLGESRSNLDALDNLCVILCYPNHCRRKLTKGEVIEEGEGYLLGELRSCPSMAVSCNGIFDLICNRISIHDIYLCSSWWIRQT